MFYIITHKMQNEVTGDNDGKVYAVSICLLGKVFTFSI